jgi:hypothetical protein
MPYKDWEVIRKEIATERQRLQMRLRYLRIKRERITTRNFGDPDLIGTEKERNITHALNVNADIAKRPWAFDPYYLPLKPEVPHDPAAL